MYKYNIKNKYRQNKTNSVFKFVRFFNNSISIFQLHLVMNANEI